MSITQFGKKSKSDFLPPRWLQNAHVQTIFSKYAVRSPQVKTIQERVLTPDQDFVDLAWHIPKHPKSVAVMFHGLEGSVNSHYLQHMLIELDKRNIIGVVMHFRGCSGETNLKPRAYHSGATFDPEFIVPLIKNKYPTLPLVALGFSLGGNMLMKLMAHHTKLPIDAAVCVSAPLNLSASSESINDGFSRVYQNHLMKSMKANLLDKMEHVDLRSHLKVSKDEIRAMQTFREFDEHITAVLHGFKGAQDYYQKCSALGDLHLIAKPSLIIHALDDPFMDKRVIPSSEQINSNVAYEYSEYGGHVGFLKSLFSGPQMWLPNRIANFIEEVAC